jgi:SPP1 gp7 family putative phage head morphogenesis protein
MPGVQWRDLPPSFRSALRSEAGMILEAAIAQMFSDEEKPPLLPKATRFADRATDEFARALQDLAESIIRLDPQAHQAAMAKVAAYIGGILTISHLLGRKSILTVADRLKPVAASVGSRIQLGAVPAVEFSEAIQDIVTREPRLARSAEAVAQVYSQQHAFALARSANLKVTQRVQQELARLMREGVGVQQSATAIAKIGKQIEGFTTAYAENVFRTNTMSAFTAGEFEQAQDPDVADLVPAFEFSAVGDGDTRDNHQAADGLVAAVDDPIWQRFAPPLGFQCRCAIISRDVYWLRSMNLIDDHGNVRKRIPPNFAAAHPDPGFGQGRGIHQGA